MVPVWKLNAAQVLGLAAVAIAIGGWLKRRISLLDRLNIPVPVAGGLLFSIASLALRDRVANFEADTMLRDLLMIAFMTTIGLSARLQLLKQGGVGMVVLLALASFGAVVQNLLGIGLAAALGIDKRLGILSGSVALAGGPGTAVAFGGTFEKMGVPAAAAVALASATFGIMIAGLIGGYIGGRLIRRHGLKSTAAAASATAGSGENTAPPLLNLVVVMGLAMGL